MKLRKRYIMETKAELEALREKADKCADLMEKIMESPYPWTYVGFALMLHCVQTMICGWTPVSSQLVFYLSERKSPEREHVDLHEALNNFKSMHSVGNAAVLYHMLREEWHGNGNWVVDTENALRYFIDRFSAMRGLGLDGFITEPKPDNRWISVTDELPKHGECVLVYADSIELAVFDSSGNSFYHFWDGTKDDIYGVTHWQPLPAPPSD